MEQYLNISTPGSYKLPALGTQAPYSSDVPISREEALDAIGSRGLAQYTDQQLLYRITIYTNPFVLEYMPQDREEPLNSTHRPWLEAYNVLLSILPRVDFATLDEIQPPTRVRGGNSKSIFQQLAGTSSEGRTFLYRDNSEIARQLVKVYPSFSPQSTETNLENLNRFDAEVENFSFKRLPPRVEFIEYLAANLLVQNCYRSVLFLMTLFANVDETYLDLLMHTEALFCLCRLRYPPIPNLETRVSRYLSLLEYSGEYGVLIRQTSTGRGIQFSTLLSMLYPARTNGMLRELEARNSAPLAYFACFTSTALESRIKENFQGSGFSLTSATTAIGMKIPDSALLYSYFVANVVDYNSVAWFLENEKQNSSFIDTERYRTARTQVGVYALRSDTYALFSVGFVYYSSRRELLDKIEAIDQGRGTNFYLLPEEKSDRCNNDEDPVSFEDLGIVFVIGNRLENTCVNLYTLYDLMREENLETYRGLFDPSTEDVFSYDSVQEIANLLMEYGGIADPAKRERINGMKNFYYRLETIEETFSQLSSENQNKIYSILMSLFLAGMYMRGWEGGIDPYPLEARQTFCEISPEKEVQYSREFTTAKTLMESSNEVYSLVDSMNVYNIESRGVLEQKNNSLLNLVLSVREETCLRMLSNELLATTASYLSKLFDTVPEGFDINRLDKIVLSVQELRQARREGATSEEISVFEEVQGPMPSRESTEEFEAPGVRGPDSEENRVPSPNISSEPSNFGENRVPSPNREARSTNPFAYHTPPNIRNYRSPPSMSRQNRLRQESPPQSGSRIIPTNTTRYSSSPSEGFVPYSPDDVDEEYNEMDEEIQRMRPQNRRDESVQSENDSEDIPDLM